MDPSWKRYCPDGSWLEQIATHRHQIVVGYLPSPAPGLPITTVQPTAIHPRPKHSKPLLPSFPSLSRNPRVPSQFPSPPPHSQTQLAPVVTVVAPPRDAGRWPLLSHMPRLELEQSSSYLSRRSTCRHCTATPPNPTCHHCARVLYSTKYKTYKLEI